MTQIQENIRAFYDKWMKDHNKHGVATVNVLDLLNDYAKHSQEEIERLKALIEKGYKSHIRDLAIERQWVVSNDELEKYWQQFKIDNHV
jgi:hypothetical protein